MKNSYIRNSAIYSSHGIFIYIFVNILYLRKNVGMRYSSTIWYSDWTSYLPGKSVYWLFTCLIWLVYTGFVYLKLKVKIVSWKWNTIIWEPLNFHILQLFKFDWMEFSFFSDEMWIFVRLWRRKPISVLWDFPFSFVECLFRFLSILPLCVMNFFFVNWVCYLV